eukprot:Nk52_evm14s235 gene=Nk52_evmTU14s235
MTSRNRSNKSWIRSIVKDSNPSKRAIRESDVHFVAKYFREICKSVMRSLFDREEVWIELKKCNTEDVAATLDHLERFKLFVCPTFDMLTTEKKREMLKKVVENARSREVKDVEFRVVDGESIRLLFFGDVEVCLNKTQIGKLMCQMLSYMRSEVNRLVKADKGVKKFIQTLTLPTLSMGLDNDKNLWM